MKLLPPVIRGLVFVVSSPVWSASKPNANPQDRLTRQAPSPHRSSHQPNTILSSTPPTPSPSHPLPRCPVHLSCRRAATVQVDVLFHPRDVCACRRRLGEASPQQAERGGFSFLLPLKRKRNIWVFSISNVFSRGPAASRPLWISNERQIGCGFLKSELLSVRMITAEDSSKASRATALPLCAPSQAAVGGRRREGGWGGRRKKEFT